MLALPMDKQTYTVHHLKRLAADGAANAVVAEAGEHEVCQVQDQAEEGGEGEGGRGRRVGARSKGAAENCNASVDKDCGECPAKKPAKKKTTVLNKALPASGSADAESAKEEKLDLQEQLKETWACVVIDLLGDDVSDDDIDTVVQGDGRLKIPERDPEVHRRMAEALRAQAERYERAAALYEAAAAQAAGKKRRTNSNQS